MLCGASTSISDSHEKVLISRGAPECALEYWGWLKWSTSSSTLSVSPNLWRMPHTWSWFCEEGKYVFSWQVLKLCLVLSKASWGPVLALGPAVTEWLATALIKSYPSAKGIHIHTTCWEWCQGCTNSWTMAGEVLYGKTKAVLATIATIQTILNYSNCNFTV